MLPDGGLEFVSEEGFDYDGPLALCDRGQSKDANKQATSFANANEGMGAQSFASGNAAIGAENQEAYNKWARDSAEFAPGGEFAQVQQGNEDAATAGGKGSTDDYMRDYAAHTGIGPTTSQMIASSEEAGRANQRDEAQAARDDEMKRLAGLDAANKDWINSKQQVAADYAGYYAPSIGGATGQTGNAIQAAKEPSFWDMYLQDASAAAGAAAKGAAS